MNISRIVRVHTSITHIILPAAGALFAALLLFGLMPSAHASESVELGIIELSPRGEAGGYAMPASGSSNTNTVTTSGGGTCSLTNSPYYFPQGSLSTMRVTASLSGYTNGSIISYERCNSAGSGCVTLINTSSRSYNMPVSSLGAGSYRSRAVVSYTQTTETCTGSGKERSCNFVNTTATSRLCSAAFTVQPPPVNGTCGPAAKNYTYNEAFPAGATCNSGTASGVANPPEGGSDTWQCVGSNGGSTASCSATRDIGSPTVTLTANPGSVAAGGDSTLEWTVAGATSCSASGDWSGSQTATDGTHTLPITGLTADSTYTLTCTGNALPDASDSATVTILPQCSDGIDNDGDGSIDSGNDAGCDDGNDDNEGDGAPDLVADVPSLITAGPFEENKVDDLSFASVVTNAGDTTGETINYSFQLDLDRDGSVNDSEPGSQSGGLNGGDSFTTSPIETFTDIRAGDHRVRFVVDPVPGEVVTSNNDSGLLTAGNGVSGWIDFTVDAATVNLVPSITSDRSIIRADTDGADDITISWDTDQWPSCALEGPGMPATATSADSNTIGIDGSEGLDIDTTATFTITCTDPVLGDESDSVTVQVLPQIFET